MVSDLDSYVFVCPNFGEEFKTLEDYLEYSEGQHDYWISDYLGASYYFGSVEDYRQWVRDELIAKGLTLKQWVRQQRNLAFINNYDHDKTYRILLQFKGGRRQLLRLARTELWQSIGRIKRSRETALTQCTSC
ncbi:hypothetical protein [Nostoc sp.]|uniref:hypothetical protein n=1 Tax=Nostoc sp. TaxID=1180 RepID=UPI002FF4C72A